MRQATDRAIVLYFASAVNSTIQVGTGVPAGPTMRLRGVNAASGSAAGTVNAPTERGAPVSNRFGRLEPGFKPVRKCLST